MVNRLHHKLEKLAGESARLRVKNQKHRDRSPEVYRPASSSRGNSLQPPADSAYANRIFIDNNELCPLGLRYINGGSSNTAYNSMQGLGNLAMRSQVISVLRRLNALLEPTKL